MGTLGEVFGCLHDGVIDEVEQEGKELRFYIEAENVGYGGDAKRLVVVVKNVNVFEWEGDDDSDSLEGAEILSTRDDDGVLTVGLDLGTLRLSCESVMLLDERGEEIPFSALEEASNAYWESFQK